MFTFIKNLYTINWIKNNKRKTRATGALRRFFGKGSTGYEAGNGKGIAGRRRGAAAGGSGAALAPEGGAQADLGRYGLSHRAGGGGVFAAGRDLLAGVGALQLHGAHAADPLVFSGLAAVLPDGGPGVRAGRHHHVPQRRAG